MRIHLLFQAWIVLVTKLMLVFANRSWNSLQWRKTILWDARRICIIPLLFHLMVHTNTNISYLLANTGAQVNLNSSPLQRSTRGRVFTQNPTKVIDYRALTGMKSWVSAVYTHMQCLFQKGSQTLSSSLVVPLLDQRRQCDNYILQYLNVKPTHTEK